MATRKGVAFYPNKKLIRKLLLVGQREREGKRPAPVFKKGVYIVSPSIDSKQYKIGLSRNAYNRINQGYSLCFSQKEQYRLIAFVEVNAGVRNTTLRTFERGLLGQLKLSKDHVNEIEFNSKEWIARANKTSLMRDLIRYLNKSDDWIRMYTFAERVMSDETIRSTWKCTSQRRGRKLTLSMTQPGRRSQPCSIDRERFARLSLTQTEPVVRKTVARDARERRSISQLIRAQNQTATDPLAEAISRSRRGVGHRRTA